MISSIHIRNYQSHSDSYTELNKGVNVFCGSSDSGKTAFAIRALCWLFTNKPSGTEFMSNWADETSVEIKLDGHTINRLRSKSINSYFLDGMEFKALGTDVPKEILDILNIEPLNVSRQHDSSFLLSSTAGETAIFFNRIAHLDQIDRGTSNVNSAIRRLTSEIEYGEKEEKRLLSEMSKFDYLPVFENEVATLEALEESYRKKKLSYLNLETTVYAVEKTILNIVEASIILRIEKPVDTILDLYKKKAEKEERLAKLSVVVSQIEKSISMQEEIKEILLDEMLVEKLLKLYEERKIKSEAVRRLSEALSTLSNINSQGKARVSEIASLEAQFEKELPEGSVCPTCNQIIKRR